MHQYKGGWHVGADARRYLTLNYATKPEELRTAKERSLPLAPRDMWQEIAADVIKYAGGGPDVRGMDVGTSSGYMVWNLAEQGYSGELLAVDIDTTHFPFLEELQRRRFPDLKLTAGEADARSLRNITIEAADGAERRVKLAANSFDYVIESQIHHHLDDPAMAYNAAYRLLKPGGIGVFAGRGINHQLGIWHMISETAENFNFKQVPRSPYSEYPVDQMQADLENDPRFNIIKYGARQFGRTFIPNTDEHWPYYRSAILFTLLATSKEARTQLNGKMLENYLDGYVHTRYFTRPRNMYKGYHVDWVDQNYFVCEAVK